ncbi:Retrovirus-related Pol poly from transposon [Brachionus plicatilis]|uniref:Retrovirus-related Pol poly from transposon n=1 Tax=Brachionus plicatilis TaxID=10195 RepID=A0A3M7SK14_BRAPC|nr:Retrovirus-related Pol poly from transposon [Brachionus plicatilis]
MPTWNPITKSLKMSLFDQIMELKITPTKFTTNQDFNVWKKVFERYAKNVADKTNALLSLMEEICIEQLEQRLLIRNPNATYEETIKISSKLFGRNPIYNDPLMEFVHRTQLQNETIFQFMFELENLAAKAYLQHDERYREPIIVDRFIRGLRDNRVQSELCQTETIETIQEILDKANQLEIGFQKFSKNLQFAKQLHHPKSHSHQNLKLPNEQQISNNSSTVAENFEGDCLINDILTHFQIDTGSDITAISDKKYKDLPNGEEMIQVRNDITGADGSNLVILGRTGVKMQFGTYIAQMNVYIIKDLVQESLIGLDFVYKFNGFRLPIVHLKSTLKNFTITTIHNYNKKLKQSQLNNNNAKP